MMFAKGSQQTREAPITINKVLESFLFCSSELSLLATDTNLLELSLARIVTWQAQITISDKAAVLPSSSGQFPRS